MAELKTKANRASVDAHLAAIAGESRRADCRALAKLMARITRCKPRMWGASMVGFGDYHYKYPSGHEGDSSITGFASRKPDLTIYIGCGIEEQADLMARLGKYKADKSRLYLRRLADVDRKVLETLIARSVAAIRTRYG